MPFLDSSKINISLKKLLGKAATDNAKEPSNEAKASFVQVASSFVLGEALNTDPDNSTLYALTGNVEFVRLVLVPDLSANGHAFIAQLPADYASNSSNSKKGTFPFENSQILSETSGKLQIVPPLFGLKYEAKPYRGGSAAKGSGSLVPPGDAVDFYVDYANGVIFQENDPALAPAAMTHLECFIYTGKMVNEVIEDSIGGAVSEIPVSEAQGSTSGLLELITQVPTTDAKALKWLISAQKGSFSYAAEVYASIAGTNVAHQLYGIQTLGNPVADFMDVDVDILGGNVRLLASTSDTGVMVDVTQILVR